MECPNCKAQNPDDSIDCASCGIVYAKWRKRQGEAAAAAMGAPGTAAPAPAAPTGLPTPGVGPSPAAPEASSGGGKLTGLLMAVVGAGLGWWLFSAQGAGGADKQGLQDPKAGYAINPPAGWRSTPGSGCTVKKAPCVSIDFEKDVETEGPKPAFQVALLPGPPKKVGEGALEELAVPHKTRMSGQVRGFTQAQLAVVDVGGIKAMRFEGSGKKKVKFTIQEEKWTNEDAYVRGEFAKGKQFVSYTARHEINPSRVGGGGMRPGAVKIQEGIYEDRDVDMVLGVTVVPGRKVNYQLSTSCQEQDCLAADDAAKEAMASFREFKGPRPIDSWGGPNAPLPLGLLVALTITILWGLAKLVIG